MGLIRQTLTAGITALGIWGASVLPLQAEPVLIMVDQPGCYYCELWTTDIGPIYPKTPEGQFAPLVRRDIDDGPPEGGRFARRVSFTPTFVLMDDGAELARIEGYPGEDFFWGLLGMMLKAHTDFAAADATDPAPLVPPSSPLSGKS
ncbi:MAG: thioredoxin family protein [Paracoccaceae bacterium]